MKRFIAVLAFALAACGGGGGESPAPATPAEQPAPAAKPVRIEMYGDSTTVGWDFEGKGEPYSLQALVPKNVTVVNEGVNGMSAVNLLNGTDGKHLPWVQTMANSRADIVTINFGMNDVITTSLQDYGIYMRQLVDIARQAGKLVVLQQPNPTCAPPRMNLVQYVRELDGIAQEKGVPIVKQFDLILAMPNWRSLMTDCIHPDKDKYPIKAYNTFLLLEGLNFGAK